MVTHATSAETHGCTHITKQPAHRRSLLTSTSPSRAFLTWLAADRVNGARKARFNLSFTDPFTLRPILSHTELITCARHADEVGRGQNTRLGWSDPAFVQMLVAKRPQGSLQPITLSA